MAVTTLGGLALISPRGFAATLLAVLLLAAPASAQFASADAVLAFSQPHIVAEATAADAVQAKDRALASGRRLAWQALIASQGGGGQGGGSAQSAPSLSDAQIDDLVASIIVEQERVTPTRYSGRITVNFIPDRVRAVLGGRPLTPGAGPSGLAGGALGSTPAGAPASTWVQATASYRSFGEWLELRRRLVSAGAVASVEVQSIAVDAARLRLGLRVAPAQAAGDLGALGVALQPGAGLAPGDAWRVGLAGGG